MRPVFPSPSLEPLVPLTLALLLSAPAHGTQAPHDPDTPERNTRDGTGTGEIESPPPLIPGSVQLGPRPFHLVDRMAPGPLRDRLAACARDTAVWERSGFSIAHRGAPLQFPEHTREGYLAAARTGAGAIECDVTFTKDHELVCRHAQCDLHATTDILATPLAEKCSEPFRPARFDDDGTLLEPASARCCASDLTLEEFRTLRGRMEGVDPSATSVDGFLDGTPAFRTDLYAETGTLMTHAESIALFRELGVAMTPELKAPEVPMPHEGFTRLAFADALVAEYRAAGVPADRVRLQSFDLGVIQHWERTAPLYGARAVYLDARAPEFLAEHPPSRLDFEVLAALGVHVIGPPVSALLAVDDHGELVASTYARRARGAGLDLIGWTVERSGRIGADVLREDGGFYYGSIAPALEDDGDVYRVIDALVHRAGVIGLFSDWPATTTFYANCAQNTGGTGPAH